MNRFLRQALLSVAILCGSAGAEAAIWTPPGIAIRTLGHGVQLTDDAGLSLYTYERDARDPGKSACGGACAKTYPPLLATQPPTEPREGWAVIKREDGSLQWTYQGRPLYRYARDLEPGAVFGEGDGWSVAFSPIITPAEISIVSTVRGQVLATATGRTLYVRSGNDRGRKCDRACEQSWIPLKAPWMARASGPFSVFKREDGFFQWAFEDQPLFSFAGDAKVGDVKGDGREGGWAPKVLEPAPTAPDWVKVVGSDGGPLYGNSEGRTLYRLMLDSNATDQAYHTGSRCDEACLAEFWTPVLADKSVPRIGNWSVIDTKDGRFQWTYKGMPLYLLKLESQPGELYYTTYRKFLYLRPIMYELPALQGVF